MNASPQGELKYHKKYIRENTRIELEVLKFKPFKVFANINLSTIDLK